MRQVLTAAGFTIPLEDYQKEQGLTGSKVAKYFSAEELDCKNGALTIAEPLLRLLDAYRIKVGKPVKINSGFRTKEKQEELKGNKNVAAASRSPHCVGMGADIETKTRAETLAVAKLLEEVAKTEKINIRLGFTQYLNKGQTFVHVDVTPEYYAKGKPFHKLAHPPVWETAFKKW